MKILSLFVLLACVAFARSQDEGESRAPSRGLLKRGLLPKGKQTTTTTTQAPKEELAEYEDEGDYPQEAVSQEPSTEPPPSSTEGKKLGGVRPFRSNADLLETLKKRRAQVAEAKLHGPTTTTAAPVQDGATEAPKSTFSSKKRFNTPVRESNNEETQPAAKPSRSRFGKPSRSIQDSEPEEHNDAAPPAKSRFSRRGGN